MGFQVGSLVSTLITSRSLKAFRRWSHDLSRRARSGAHEVIYFHQPDDPYSHLLAQVLPGLQSHYNVNLQVRLVNEPRDEVVPERAALEGYARRDAAKIAPFHGLTYQDLGRQPSASSVWLARRSLAASSNLVTAAAQISDALWRDDTGALERMALVSGKTADDIFAAGTKLRDSRGHYLGGCIYYAGEWYWGIDRLPYLEERLTAAKLRHSGCRQLSQFQERPEFMPKPASGRLTVEFYPSIRSPYSYVAMAETLALPNHYPIDLVIRPVLPMVMRGLPVPRRKGLYILADTKREADRIGVAFGKVADPVGEPVRRGYSLFPMAEAAGKGGAFLHAFCQLCWSEGVDMGTDVGLQKAVKRAGLDWAEAEKMLGNEDWQEMEKENRQMLLDCGLWGVPSYRLLDGKGKELFSCWGRDRIWLLAHEIQKALAA